MVGRKRRWGLAWLPAWLLATSAVGLARPSHGASHNRQASSESPQQNSAAAPHSTSATTVTPGAATTTSGTVKTAEGAPVPSATVRLTNTDTNKSWVSWTDEAGKFEFPTLPAGHYRVEASQLGFVKSSTEMQLPLSANKPVAVILRVATLAELTATPEGAARPRSNGDNGTGGQGRRQFGGGGNSGNAGGGRARALWARRARAVAADLAGADSCLRESPMPLTREWPAASHKPI